LIDLGAHGFARAGRSPEPKIGLSGQDGMIGEQRGEGNRRMGERAAHQERREEDAGAGDDPAARR
jgi:hypothetical protein